MACGKQIVVGAVGDKKGSAVTSEIEGKQPGRRRYWTDEEIREAIALLRAQAPNFWNDLSETLRARRDLDTLGAKWATFHRVLGARFSDDDFIGGLDSLLWQRGGLDDILGARPPLRDLNDPKRSS